MSDTSVDLSNAMTFRQQWSSGRRWVHEAWDIFTQNPLIWLALALLTGLASLFSEARFGFVIQAAAQIIGTSLLVVAAAQWQRNGALSWPQLKDQWLASSGRIISLALFAVLLTVLGNLLVNLALNGVASYQMPQTANLGLPAMSLLLLISFIHAAIFAFSPACIALNQQTTGSAISSSITTFIANLPAILGAFFSMLFWIILYVLLGMMLGWMLLKLLEAVTPSSLNLAMPWLRMLFMLPVIAMGGLIAFTSWRALLSTSSGLNETMVKLQDES